MKYRVLITFRDLEDGHLYQADDPFPHDGRNISVERLEALITGNNNAKLRLIEQTNTNIPVDTENAPKPVKRRKTKA